MSRILEDGRTLFADAVEARRFFEYNRIVGRVIKDIRPAKYDYIIANLCDFDEETILGWSAPDGIETDRQICLIFEDGDSLEMELPGEAPLILGFNTADLESYPEYDGMCYRLSTMYPWVLGKRIENIQVEESKYGMKFPSYKGVNMSRDGAGIGKVVLVLEGGVEITLWGVIDFFCVDFLTESGEHNPVPFSALWDELSPECRELIRKREEWKEHLYGRQD